MALTDFYVGEKARASHPQSIVDEIELLETPQVVSSTSNSSDIGTTTTAILTLSNCVFKAGCAYKISMTGLVHSDAAGRLADFSVYKTNTSGTQYVAFGRTRAEGAGTPMRCGGFDFVRRSAGTDLTTDIVLAVTASAGTVTHEGAATRPRALIVQYVGPATAWSYALDVT
jgi:hypothetical protein